MDKTILLKNRLTGTQKYYLSVVLFLIGGYFLLDENNIIFSSIKMLVQNGLLRNLILFMFYISIIDLICLFKIIKNINIFMRNKLVSVTGAVIGCMFLPYEVIYETNYSNYAFLFNLALGIVGIITLVLIIPNMLHLLEDSRFMNNSYKSKSIIFYLVPFITISITWIMNYPALLSYDSNYQLDQIATSNYNDVHPAAHTLFMKLLMQINNSPATVIFFQIIFMCLAVGYIFNYFSKNGVSERLLIPILVIWSCLTPIRITTCFLWKDVFYAIALLITTIYLIRIVGIKEKLHLIDISIFAINLSAILLFRHNGLISFIAISTVLIFFVFKFKSLKYVLPIIISLMIALPVKTIVYNVYNVQPNTNGTKYAILAKSIVSVVVNGGNYTQEEFEQITQIIPYEVIKRNYNWSQGQNFLWNMSDSDAKYGFGSTLAGKGRLLISLFIKLFPRNVGIMFWDIIGSSSLLWKLDFIRIDFLSINMVYLLPMIICSALFIRNKNMIGLIPFVPVVSNIFSIAMSNISYEPRYGYPTIVLSSVLFTYTYYNINKNKLESSD